MKASTKRLHLGMKSKNSGGETFYVMSFLAHFSQAGNCSPCERGEPP